MESKPIEVIPEDKNEKVNGNGEKKKLEDMEFEIDDSLLQVQKSDIEHDQELLQIQRRKSTPKVVVEEFVAVDSGDESDGSDGKAKKQEENKEHEILGDDGAVNKRPHKVKTHIEIDDVSTSPSNPKSFKPISIRSGTSFHFIFALHIFVYF